MEKGFLCVFEVFFGSVMKRFIFLLLIIFDLFKIFQECFFKLILFNVKFSNVVIRVGVVDSFCVIVMCCSDQIFFVCIVDEIVMFFKGGKLVLFDYRLLYVEMLQVVILLDESVEVIVVVIVIVVVKEGNEVVLVVEIIVMVKVNVYLLQKWGEFLKVLVDVIVKGLIEKKFGFCRLWFLCVGDIVLFLVDCDMMFGVIVFVDVILFKMVDVFNDVIVNFLIFV